MRIGVDLGGTKTEIIVLGDDHATLLRERIPTPKGDYRTIIAAVVALVERVERDLGQRGLPVGVGIPGSVSRVTGLVRNSNVTALNGQAFEADLGRHLGRDVKTANDANCLALSEAVDGAGQGCATVFGVILGTGLGGGLVRAGRIVEGANGIASEVGHIPLQASQAYAADAPHCYCGKRGCAESWLSGAGFERAFAVATGRTLPAAEIVALACEGDKDAAQHLATYQDHLARHLAMLVNIVDPDVFVLGGGMSNVAGLAEALPNLMEPHIFADQAQITLRRAAHGDSSGVRGAAFLNDRKT